MIDINRVNEGDVVAWMGKCGEIRGTVKRIESGELVAMTDEVHCIPLSHLCDSHYNHIVSQNPVPPAPKPIRDMSSDEIPVLF